MAKPDGKITFSTEIDNSGLAKQVAEAEKKVKSLESQIAKLNKEQANNARAQTSAQNALTKAQQEQAAAEERMQKATEAALDAKLRLQKAQETLNRLQNEKARQDSVASGTSGSVDPAEFLNNYKTADEWKKEIGEAARTVSDLEKELKSAEASANKVGEAFLNAQAKTEEAEAALRNASNAAGQTAKNIDAANAELSAAKEDAGNLEKELEGARDAAKGMKKPIDAVDKQFQRLGKRLTRMVATVLVFNVLRRSLRSLADYYGEALKGNEEITAQLAELEGAFYTAFQPVYEYALPLIKEVLKGLTGVLQVAGALTSALFGKSYEQMQKNAKALNEQATATDKLGASAKNASKYLAGFDDLNVLTAQEETETVDIVPKFDTDMDAFGADAEQWQEKLQPVAEIVKNVAGALESISTGLLPIIGTIIAGKLFAGIKNTWSKIKSLKILGSLKNAEGGVSAIGVAASAAAAAFEFSTVKDSVKDLALGCDNAAGKVAAIGVAAAVAGKVMYTAFGPVGIVFAAVTALAGAIAGVQSANEEMMKSFTDAEFYSGTGTKISDLGKAFEDTANKIALPFKTLSSAASEISGSKTELDTVAQSIGGILATFSQNYDPTEDEVKKLKELFYELRDAAKETMGKTYDYLYNAVTGALGVALADAGSSSAEILSILHTLRGDATGELEKLYDEIEQELADLEGGLTGAELELTLGTLQGHLEKVAELSGATLEFDVSGTFDSMLRDLESIDWEDEDKTKAFFDSVTKAYSDAATSIEQSTDEMYSAMNDAARQMKALGYDQSTIDSFVSTMTTAIDARGENAKKELSNKLVQLYDAAQKDALKKLPDIESAADVGYDETSLWHQLFTSRADHVRDALETYVQGTLTDLTDEMKKSLDGLGIDGSVWASDAASSILDSAFFWDGAYLYPEGKSLEDLINEAIAENAPDSMAAIENTLNAGLEQVGKSGAEAAEEAGEKIAAGLNKGLASGGRGITVSMNFTASTMPNLKIPALAEGRVLPANHPFLAMVGDQKHGTNVEAPLSTIQEAVALTMEDNTNGMMAGFEALQAELQQLRAVVEGIEVGDSTIGKAANRYNQKMAVIRG